jgi:deoxyribodipyrimidine photo-lyase
MQQALYWLRNDLRLHDNAALLAFCQQAQQGLMLWTPTVSFLRADRFRRHFILGCLHEFKLQAERRGARVLVLNHSLKDCLSGLQPQANFQALFCSEEAAPEEQAEIAALARIPELKPIPVSQGSLLGKDLLPFAVAKTPEVFTQFRKQIEGAVSVQSPIAQPKQIPGWDRPLSLTELKELDFGAELSSTQNQHPRIQPGEAAGLQRVQQYIWDLDRLRVYKETRNGLMNWEDSSKFSPWLSVGALSPRQIYAEVRRYEDERCQNDSTYWMYFELLWRDYFRFIVEKHGARLFSKQRNPQRKRLEQSQQQEVFASWAAGETSDDFVNANMRELNQTGWMSNRGRQNVASYLAKTLAVDWRLGAAYFERMLIDYDVYSNWGNWAYLAGVGQDPRDRSFNTRRQAEMYDPDGAYRSLWLGKA